MRPTAVDSSFEIAFWFLDRAVEDGEYLQPQKLHRLMYLAQAYFAVLQNGAKLMPATFIAKEEGPIEPTIYKAMARGRPMIDIAPIEDVPRHVLDSVWRQFGAHSVDYLDKMIRRHPPYADALAVGVGSEIPLEAMIDFYSTQGTSRKSSRAAVEDAPAASKVLRPKVMRNHSGKPVSTTRWMPKRVD
jgi:uncharacterized phage-associated protein